MNIRKAFFLSLATLGASSALLQAEDSRLFQRLECLSLREAKLGETVRLISTVSGMPVVATPQAAETVVSCYFTDVTLEVGLQAVCRAHDLWLNISPEGVIIISTLDQHLASQTHYSADHVETIIVKYPSVYDVGDTLKGLFRDRIVWERPNLIQNDPIARVEQAIDRMDLLADRSQFDDVNGGGSNSSNRSGSGSGSRSGSGSGSGSRSGSGSNRSNSGGANSNRSSLGNNGIGNDTKQIESMMRTQEVIDEQVRELMAKGMEEDDYRDPIALVYLAALPEINTLLIRSGDREAVQSVLNAIESMDKPRGQVLLKVTVLSVELSDDISSGVEWLFSGGNHSAGLANEPILPLKIYDFGQGAALNPAAALGVNGAVETITSSFVSGTPAYAFYSDDLRVRAKFLEENKDVRQLASPTLLVADNEAANVFVGTAGKFLDQINPGETIVTDGIVTSLVATPELIERNIGFSLLITPRVHADRTVTLRIMQERSQIDPNLRSINYGTNDNILVQDIDQQTVTSTLVAEDRSLVVLGGLVQEGTNETDSGVPVLKDIPVLGRAFSNTRSRETREELIILIQPHVLAIPGEAQAASDRVLDELLPTNEILPTRNSEPVFHVVEPKEVMRDAPSLPSEVNQPKNKKRPVRTAFGNLRKLLE